MSGCPLQRVVGQRVGGRVPALLRSEESRARSRSREARKRSRERGVGATAAIFALNSCRRQGRRFSSKRLAKAAKRRGWQPPRGRAATSLRGIRRWVAPAGTSWPRIDLGRTSVLRSGSARSVGACGVDVASRICSVLRRRVSSPAARAVTTSRAERILVRDTPVLAPRCRSQISNFNLEMTVLSAVQRIGVQLRLAEGA